MLPETAIRFVLGFATAACVGGLVPRSAETPQLAGKHSLFVAARHAIYKSNIRTVRTLEFRGIAFNGFNGVTAQPSEDAKDLVIRLRLPDGYLRVERDSLVELKRGFNGTAAISRITAVRDDVRVGGGRPPVAISVRTQREAAFLWLGILADPDAIFKYVVTQKVTAAGSISLQLRDGAGDSIWVDFDEASGFPNRVRYKDRLGFYKALSADARKQGVPAPPTPEDAEVVMTFGQRRSVDGVFLPFNILMSARGIRFDELRLKDVSINPDFPNGSFR